MLFNGTIFTVYREKDHYQWLLTVVIEVHKSLLVF